MYQWQILILTKIQLQIKTVMKKGLVEAHFLIVSSEPLENLRSKEHQTFTLYKRDGMSIYSVMAIHGSFDLDVILTLCLVEFS